MLEKTAGAFFDMREGSKISKSPACKIHTWPQFDQISRVGSYKNKFDPPQVSHPADMLLYISLTSEKHALMYEQQHPKGKCSWGGRIYFSHHFRKITGQLQGQGLPERRNIPAGSGLWVLTAEKK
ncbi:MULTISPECIES: hypothetical protein [unclassified Methanoregula]|uniref:hypothetical protein n=1 Tax=unclassified Methanoregula TaxID=2649730 RepID=UPI0009CB1B78|nr:MULTISPECIES: hypothetical protein [unclassified Methanoregula]OPX62041.1 MAG: hypothetical protein A4E33_02639 [Methanoregula sp. PtaB.Bin085]OPY36582.1 MAG: hypothetical protein A4E34_00276 [Methanoregula sp. PtaU1.Bin006]